MTELDGGAALHHRVTSTYRGNAHPERAPAMAAYMRDQFPFLGIQSAERVALNRQITAGLPRPSESDLIEVAHACWQEPEREFQYFAVSYLRKHVASASSDRLPTVEQLLTTKSWWDTVDELAQHVVGPLVAAHPQLRAEMDRWVADENIWLARSAILHQLRYREHTDRDQLFDHCLRRAAHPDPFIRKAIGWALRSYARTEPAAVAHFVAEHADRLSGLSQREALKHSRTWHLR